MRLSLLPALGMAVALSGCVMAVPAPTAPPPVTVTPAPTAPVVVTPRPNQPVVVTPSVRTVDAGSARQVVSAELARRYPGRNVGPMADCVIANATMAEQSELLAGAGTPRANDAMAAIVKKPATAQCIARAGALA